MTGQAFVGSRTVEEGLCECGSRVPLFEVRMIGRPTSSLPVSKGKRPKADPVRVWTMVLGILIVAWMLWRY
jgi:hypothetical protein